MIIIKVGIWKCSLQNFSEVPTPEGHDWIMGDSGLKPLWCEKQVLPDNLTDLLCEEQDSDVEPISSNDIIEDTDSSDDDL